MTRTATPSPPTTSPRSSSPRPRTSRVLLVTDSNYFLEKLKGSLQLKDFDIVTPCITKRRRTSTMPSPSSTTSSSSTGITPKHAATGNFMYFRSLPPNVKVKPAKDGDKPIYTEDNTILDWKRDHPMLPASTSPSSSSKPR